VESKSVDDNNDTVVIIIIIHMTMGHQLLPSAQEGYEHPTGGGDPLITWRLLWSLEATHLLGQHSVLAVNLLEFLLEHFRLSLHPAPCSLPMHAHVWMSMCLCWRLRGTGLRLEMLGGEIFESLGNVGDSTVHAVHLFAELGIENSGDGCHLHSEQFVVKVERGKVGLKGCVRAGDRRRSASHQSVVAHVYALQ